MREITACLLNDTSHESHVGCGLVISVLKKLLSDVELECFGWADRVRAKERLERGVFDFVVINGEGTFHDDARAALYWMDIATAAKKRCRTKVILLNSCWYNNDKLSSSLRFIDYAVFRDRESLDNALFAFPDLPSDWCPDFAFFSDAFSRIKSQPDLLNKCKLVSDSVGVDKSFRISRQFGRSSGFYPVSLFYRVVGSLTLRRAISTMGRSRLGNPVHVFKYLSNRRHFHEFSSVDEFMSVLSNAEFVITGRYHLVVLCIFGRIPFLAFPSNTPKIELLLAELDMTYRCSGNIKDGYRKSLERFSDNEKLRIDRFMSDAYDRFKLVESRVQEIVFSSAD